MNIELPAETERKFKAFVIEKHGKLRGTLCEEVNNALLHFLECTKKTDLQEATA